MCMCPCQGTIFCFNSEGQVYDQEVRRSLYPVVCNVSALITRKIDTLYLYSVYIGEVTQRLRQNISLWMNVWCWGPRNNEQFVIRTNPVNRDTSVRVHMCRNKFNYHILSHVQWAFLLLSECTSYYKHSLILSKKKTNVLLTANVFRCLIYIPYTCNNQTYALWNILI